MSASPDNAIPSGGKAMSVLVVDDEVEVRMSLQRALGRSGYRVSLASNGQEGLQRAIDLSPAVILVDLRMPGIDGHTFVRRIKALGLDASLIVVSGHGEMDDVIDAVRAGAVDYLRKPWDPGDLFAAVRRGVQAFEAKGGTPSDSTGGAPAPDPIQVNRASEASTITTRERSAPIASPAGTESPFAAVLKRIEAGEILLPAIPSVVRDLRALVQQPESTLEDVVALIERDQKMTAQLMRLANTFQYSRGVPNPDLKTAVSRVGLKRVQALAETAAASEICPIQDPTLASLQAKIWTYSLARALAMRALAENAPGGRGLEPETAYLVGLFADVGASFLLWALAEQTPPPPLSDCITFIREHHTTIGNVAMARWGVEREMTMLARLHHSATLPEPRDPYCILEVVAASLAEQLAPDGDLTSKAARPDSLLSECSAALRVSAISKQSILARLVPELKQVLEALD